MSNDNGWNDLLALLDEDQPDDTSDWGARETLDEGDVFVGYWRGQDEYAGNYGPVPVYLLVDKNGVPCHLFGGRTQLDRGISEKDPQPGDRIAIRREQNAPATQEGYSPAWRVKVAVKPADGQAPAVATRAAADDIPFG